MKNEQMFIEGFAEKSGLSIDDAKQAWSDWTRQMGDNERAETEALGHVTGMNQGEKYAEWISKPENQ